MQYNFAIGKYLDFRNFVENPGLDKFVPLARILGGVNTERCPPQEFFGVSENCLSPQPAGN